MILKTAAYKIQLRARQFIIGLRHRRRAGDDRTLVKLDLPPERVLFVSSGLLGDSVMGTPVFSHAKRIWPNCHLTVLGKQHNRDLLSADPRIDEFRVCNADPFSVRRSQEIRELAEWLSSSDFDAAIILLGDQFAHLLADARIPVRVGVEGTPLESCLTHAYDIGSPRAWGAHERLNCLRVLGYEIEDSLPVLWIDDKAATTAKSKLKDLGIGEAEKYAVIHPFGSTPRQWWNIENLSRLAESLTIGHGLRSVLVGGAETAASSVQIPSIIDTRGKLSLNELMAVINGSEIVITTDSGPLHIAGALRKRIIGLFRSSRPEHARAYPTSEAIFGESVNCKKICEWDKCSGNPCRQMGSISVEDVIEKLNASHLFQD